MKNCSYGWGGIAAFSGKGRQYSCFINKSLIVEKRFQYA